jgi:hypothetical protein
VSGIINIWVINGIILPSTVKHQNRVFRFLEKRGTRFFNIDIKEAMKKTIYFVNTATLLWNFGKDTGEQLADEKQLIS